MKLDLDFDTNRLQITAYSADGITVNDQLVNKPFVITAEALHFNLLPAVIDTLDTTHIEGLVTLGVNILILGTGSRQILVARELVKCAADSGVGLEVMDTTAACRCYNVLVSENRAVAAALYML
jgi:uncharacterized protein